MQAIVNYLKMIKFSHTLFALPFALVAVVILWKERSMDLTWIRFFYIVAAFTAARSFAMAMNRISDARFDARNPRTSMREIPAGKLSMRSVARFALLSFIFFVVAAWFLSETALYLSVPVLFVLAGYSYAKRFSWLCHYWLGAAIGMAPLGVYIALNGYLYTEAWIMFLALSTYISGFDILYAIQDRDFDIKEKLYSIPANFGVPAALWFSLLTHVVTIFSFGWLGLFFQWGYLYWSGFALLGALIAGEHWIVGWGRNVKLHNIPVAFFHFNSGVSIVFLLCVSLELMAAGL